jgi:hydroxymethylpyrimidine pyrophosphatase-like HAD family hydrolase
MLQAADVAIAVENAVPEVKAIAQTIIGPNTTDAVPSYIAATIKQ